MELIMVSCRKNDSGLFVGELQPFVLAKDADSHKDLLALETYTVTRRGTTYSVTLAALYKQLQGKRIAILIHGYHTDFDGALKAYQSIVDNMSIKQLPYDVVIGFMWPGGITAAGFDLAIARTSHASDKLLELVSAVHPTCRYIDVETHSLGAEVALDALVKTCSVRNLILTAPAVPVNCLATNYREILDAVSQVYVLRSEGDGVLKWAFKIATFKTALGLTGPEGLRPFQLADRRVSSTPAQQIFVGTGFERGVVTSFDMSATIHEHSDYRRIASGTYEIWAALTA